ncbi:MAG: hypothetical protein IH964_10185 [Candidatus Dadabacteria bacterium]|nr:hypothetical protein [Candidatus Dadabacteria bacterium]
MIKNRFSLFVATFLIISFFFLALPETGWAQQDTFNFTNGQQSFVVPAGVFSIHIQVWGAEGASGTGGPPGLGGFAEGDLAVTPGQTLGIFVGGQGCALNSDSVITIGCGGFNGGGDARGGGTGPDLGNFRGGGGGASDVRVGGTSLNNRVIVAAGGGGACGNVSSSGGNGGGLVGSPGGLEPGEGGTQTTGGQGFNSPTCLSGGFGFGGDAGTGSCAGGGGGFFGGGSGCGGGGGLLPSLMG